MRPFTALLVLLFVVSACPVPDGFGRRRHTAAGRATPTEPRSLMAALPRGCPTLRRSSH